MCELFAMASLIAANVTFSFETFSRRGGLAGPHSDGWGVAFCGGRDVQLVREPAAAAHSPTVRFLQEHPLTANYVISHIRRATCGATSLANTQPSIRELAGRTHVFAHNGHMPGIFEDSRFRLDVYHPIGDTDSEYAFCALLTRLRRLWTDSGGVPSLAARTNIIAAFAGELAALGPANFIYHDGDALFAHGHRRTQGDKTICPPGLHILCRSCHRAPQTGPVTVTSEAGEQRVVLFASVPLTDERWRPLREGELVVARNGAVVSAPAGARGSLPRR